MDKKKIEIVVVAIGGIILAALVVQNIGKVVSGHGARTPSAPTIAVAELESIFTPKKAEAEKRREAKDLAWGRDPFVLGGGTAEVSDTIASLKLMGITARGTTKAVAIINNEMVHEGTKIGKFTVVKILQKKVVVTDGKESFELLLE